MFIVFEMPADQDWEPEYWDRIGEDPGFDQVATDIEAAGGTLEDTEDVTIECEKSAVPAILAVIEAARQGQYGADVQTYWNAANRGPDEE